MIKVVIAPNAFKGSMDAFHLCRILSAEINGIAESVASLPLGDGGDGTAAILASYMNAIAVRVPARDALGRWKESFYYRSGNTAIVELAEICGLKGLKPEEYDVLNAHTGGLGRVIDTAVGHGITHILLCVGGSASVDGGLGALEVMGLETTHSGNRYKNPVLDLLDISTDQLYRKFKNIQFTILCDVENPLYGPQGAASIFAPQKGASPEQVGLLNHALEQLSQVLYRRTGISVAEIPHGGAAGGITASFFALLNARLLKGAEYCISLSPFDRLVTSSTVVITGEGKLDSQSLCGKIPGTLASLCRQKNAKIIAVTGSAEPGIKGFDRIFQLADYAPSLQESILHPDFYLKCLCRDLKKYLLEGM